MFELNEVQCDRIEWHLKYKYLKNSLIIEFAKNETILQIHQ